MRNRTGPPYIYETDKEYELLEKDYEIAFLRNHISELNLALIDRKQLLLRAQIVAVKYRDLLDGLHEKIKHLVK